MIVSLLRARSFFARFRPAALSVALLAAVSPLATTQASPYSQVIIFGDSLSDDGNLAHRTNDEYGIAYPGGNFNYSDHRFTNSSDTNPGSGTYVGVWHEQLTRRFLGMPAATNSLDGGTDYAFGGATTEDGTTTRNANTLVVGGPSVNIVIDNMGKQVNDYLSKGAVDGNALFVVWGGGNDLFNDASPTNVVATANRVGALVTKLANVGARSFVVPNVPPLGDIPEYNSGNAQQAMNFNIASSNYRDQLNAVLDSTVSSLSAQGITVQITRLDVYALFLNLIEHYSDFGFTDVRNAAQGESVNVNQSLFWDNIHPTTAGHNQIAQFAAQILPGAHPSFFSGEAFLSGDFAYLSFGTGKEFGYYSYQYYPYLYHSDLGFEYVIPSTGADNGVYLYDFKLQSFLYTSPTLYPYFYNFKESAFYYYFVGTTAPRVFFDFATGQYVYSN